MMSQDRSTSVSSQSAGLGGLHSEKSVTPRPRRASAYVGRVGALAAAMGIGAAVALWMPTAAADTSESSGTSSASRDSSGATNRGADRGVTSRVRGDSNDGRPVSTVGAGRGSSGAPARSHDDDAEQAGSATAEKSRTHKNQVRAHAADDAVAVPQPQRVARSQAVVAADNEAGESGAPTSGAPAEQPAADAPAQAPDASTAAPEPAVNPAPAARTAVLRGNAAGLAAAAGAGKAPVSVPLAEGLFWAGAASAIRREAGERVAVENVAPGVYAVVGDGGVPQGFGLVDAAEVPALAGLVLPGFEIWIGPILLIGNGTPAHPDGGLLFGHGYSWTAATCVAVVCNGGNAGLFGNGGAGFNGGNGGNAIESRIVV